MMRSVMGHMMRFVGMVGVAFIAVTAHAQTQSSPQDQRRLEQDIERMQRDIIEHNRAMQQKAQQQILDQERLQNEQNNHDREQSQDRELREQSEERARRALEHQNEQNNILLLNPPSSANGTVVIIPPSAQEVIWQEPIIPSEDRSTIILRGNFERQPFAQCLYQRWHCPQLN
jgi:TolA-binding protein